VSLVPPTALAQQAPRAAPAGGPTPLWFDEPTASVGESYQFGAVEHTFQVENRGDRAIKLLAIEPQQAGGSGEFSTDLLPPGGQASIQVRQATGGRLGRARFAWLLRTDDPDQPSPRLVVGTFVQSAYDKEYPFVEFGIIDRTRGAQAEIELASREIDSVELVEVMAKPEFVELTESGRTGVAEQSVMLKVKLLPGTPLGLRSGSIQLRTNVPHQPFYVIGFQAGVYADIVPSVPVVSLGAVRLGDAFDATFRMSSRSGRPFAVGRVEDPTDRFETSFRPCEGGDGPAACWEFRSRASIPRKGGVRGEILVTPAGSDEAIPITYSGLVAAVDAQITNLGTLTPDTKLKRTNAPEQRP
jgi:hypothetical protein